MAAPRGVAPIGIHGFVFKRGFVNGAGEAERRVARKRYADAAQRDFERRRAGFVAQQQIAGLQGERVHRAGVADAEAAQAEAAQILNVCNRLHAVYAHHKRTSSATKRTVSPASKSVGG